MSARGDRTGGTAVVGGIGAPGASAGRLRRATRYSCDVCAVGWTDHAERSLCWICGRPGDGVRVISLIGGPGEIVDRGAVEF